jgi:hypothetical protein
MEGLGGVCCFGGSTVHKGEQQESEPLTKMWFTYLRFAQ